VNHYRCVVVLFIAGVLSGGPLADLCKAEDHLSGAVTLVSPESMTSTESAVMTVRGRVAEEGWPVVVVRPIGNGVHPWFVQPKITLAADGRFEGIAHLGAADSETGAFEVCVLLTESKEAADDEYPVGRRLTCLADCPRSETIVLLRGVTEQWVRKHRLKFSGANWIVKSGVYGPGPNRWSEDNVRVDEAGVLHLSASRRENMWACAEVYIDEPLGYGEYRWTIAGRFIEYDPNVVVGLFLYEDQRKEIDFELSKWGDSNRSNAQFVIQPVSASRMHRFDTGRLTRITVSVKWHDGFIQCRCWDAERHDGALLAEWEYSGSDVPKEGELRPHINMWLVNGTPQSEADEFEVSVESFEYYANLRR
jgi:hypothetical protein